MSVVEIEASAFQGAGKVGGILNLPNLELIGSSAFPGTGITEVKIPWEDKAD